MVQTLEAFINGMPGPQGPSAYIIVGNAEKWGAKVPKSIKIGDKSYDVVLEGGGDFMARGVSVEKGMNNACLTFADGSTEDVIANAQALF